MLRAIIGDKDAQCIRPARPLPPLIEIEDNLSVIQLGRTISSNLPAIIHPHLNEISLTREQTFKRDRDRLVIAPRRTLQLDEALQFGLVPLVVGSGAPAEVLRGYVALYLREEVQTEGLVRNLGGFARFLEAVAFSHGGVLNVANVARECQVERKVVEGYLGVLEDLLLAWLVPVFSRQARRVLSSHPKFFLFDAGVYRSLRRTGPLDRPGDVEGPALEGLVAQHLRAWCAYRGGDDTLSFWRTASGNEVDFVVYGPLTFCAIEVKNTTRVRPEDLRGLRAFREDYPTSTQILLYRGTESLDLDGIRCLPCERFLRALRPDTELAVDPVLHQAE